MSNRNFCGPNRDDHWWGTWQDYDPAMPPHPYYYYRKCMRSGCDASEDVERLIPDGESRITP
jgi:hypothetical protein